MIEFGDFEKVEIRVGTIIEARHNDKAYKPGIILIIDFVKFFVVELPGFNTLEH